MSGEDVIQIKFTSPEEARWMQQQHAQAMDHTTGSAHDEDARVGALDLEDEDDEEEDTLDDDNEEEEEDGEDELGYCVIL